MMSWHSRPTGLSQDHKKLWYQSQGEEWQEVKETLSYSELLLMYQAKAPQSVPVKEPGTEPEAFQHEAKITLHRSELKPVLGKQRKENKWQKRLPIFNTRSVMQLDCWFCCKWLTTAYWSACCLNKRGGGCIRIEGWGRTLWDMERWSRRGETMSSDTKSIMWMNELWSNAQN